MGSGEPQPVVDAGIQQTLGVAGGLLGGAGGALGGVGDEGFGPGLPMPVQKVQWIGYRDTVKNFPVNDFHLLAMSAAPIRVHNLWLDRA